MVGKLKSSVAHSPFALPDPVNVRAGTGVCASDTPVRGHTYVPILKGVALGLDTEIEMRLASKLASEE